MLRRSAAVIVAGCFLLAACGGGSPSGPTVPPAGKGGLITSTYTGSGRKVAILGDSLTVMGWDDLYNGLDRQFAVVIGAKGGEGYNAGRFSNSAGGVAIIEDAAVQYATTHPAVVVLALGTNDAWHRRSTKNALIIMQTMVSEFRGACMVGITLSEHSTVKGWSNLEAHALNVAMRKWANQVVDWASMSTTPGILGSDGIHATPKGTKTRADAIIAAVKRCTGDSK